MVLPYRTRKNLARLGTVLLVLVLAFLLVYLCWVLFLERYVAYTDEGAKLDFTQDVGELSGVEAKPPEPGPTIAIYYNEGDNLIDPDNKLTQLSGYYADTDALLKSVDAISRQISGMENKCAIMLDMKSIKGTYFYNTRVTDSLLADSGSLNVQSMEKLIKTVKNKGFYLIARVPAFRDRNYVIENPNSAIPGKDSSGNASYPWPSDDSCYWLDPARGETVSLLIQIANELRDLGFDEVVFSEFYIPDTDEIYYPDEPAHGAVLAKAAADLAASCATKHFAVSFSTPDPTLQIPQGRSRLYLENVDAGTVAATVDQVTVEDALVNLVFLADTNDTRFNDYGVLRPIANAK